MTRRRHRTTEVGSAPTPWDFDSHADEYVAAVDDSVSFTGRDSDFFARRKVRILESLALRSTGRLRDLSVLDVGCGTGTTDRFLIDHVGTLSGVDVSREMVALAEKAVPAASYKSYDGETLPFPDGTFDVGVAICVLHHVPESERPNFVSELHRVTRTGGLIAIFEHNPSNPFTRFAVNSCDLDEGVVLVKGNEAVTYLEGAGSSDVTRSDFLFTPLGGRTGEAIDEYLAGIRFGGQYVVFGLADHRRPQCRPS